MRGIPDLDKVFHVLSRFHLVGVTRNTALNVSKKGIHCGLDLWTRIGGHILLFDVWDAGADESGRVGTHVVGFVSPALHLPRFSLVSHLFYKGKFGELIVEVTERLSEWKASKGGLSRLSFASRR